MLGGIIKGYSVPDEMKTMLRRLSLWVPIVTVLSILAGGVVQSVFFAWKGGAKLTAMEIAIDNKVGRLEMSEELTEWDAHHDAHIELLRDEMQARVDVSEQALHEYQLQSNREMGGIQRSIEVLNRNSLEIKGILREMADP
jgi:hypothetical protein